MKATCGMLPSSGAVHAYQIDFPPAMPAWVGSSSSVVALTLFARTKPPVGSRLTASARSSFGGASWADIADGTASRNRAATSGARRTGTSSEIQATVLRPVDGRSSVASGIGRRPGYDDSMPEFRVSAAYSPTGDQPTAIDRLAASIRAGDQYQTLLGATGTGKTATMAWIAEQVQKPTLVIAHNKTLAAQLCNEFREFLPSSAVEYFVSYYD